MHLKHMLPIQKIHKTFTYQLFTFDKCINSVWFLKIKMIKWSLCIHDHVVCLEGKSYSQDQLVDFGVLVHWSNY
jgi:hypothetical protein